MTDHNIIRGEFTVIDNRVEIASPLAIVGVIAKAHAAMVLELSRMHVPFIHVSPQPEEFEDVADYLMRLAAIWDRHVLAVGVEVKSNALCVVDLRQFTGACVGAIEGSSTHECDQAAEAQREQFEEGDDSDRFWEETRADF